MVIHNSNKHAMIVSLYNRQLFFKKNSQTNQTCVSKCVSKLVINNTLMFHETACLKN